MFNFYASEILAQVDLQREKTTLRNSSKSHHYMYNVLYYEVLVGLVLYSFFSQEKVLIHVFIESLMSKMIEECAKSMVIQYITHGIENKTELMKEQVTLVQVCDFYYKVCTLLM